MTKDPFKDISNRSTKRARKNSPTVTTPMQSWPTEVIATFKSKLARNINSKGLPYTQVQVSPTGLPPALLASPCIIPFGSSSITAVVKGFQYQRPLHRMIIQLERNALGEPFLEKDEQASHICMDEINIDGRGVTHCVNAKHMVVESDKTNKSRQRCPGWIWIREYLGHKGDYWYPSCIHQPACLRYTEKDMIPSYFVWILINLFCFTFTKNGPLEALIRKFRFN